jgi:hypothetical protein
MSNAASETSSHEHVVEHVSVRIRTDAAHAVKVLRALADDQEDGYRH